MVHLRMELDAVSLLPLYFKTGELDRVRAANLPETAGHLHNGVPMGHPDLGLQVNPLHEPAAAVNIGEPCATIFATRRRLHLPTK